jgi:Uma2 family endonuclease
MTASTLGPTQAAFLLERWQQILNDPELADYPGCIETDAHGNILMSPRPDFEHDKAAFRIRRLLEDLLPGDGSFGELEVLTDQGIKIPDVMWFDPSRTRSLKKPITPAPDICIEISSPNNNPQELIEKRDAYFRAGAREVWICSQTNTIEFYVPEGRLPKSRICSQFPKKIELYPKEAKARARHERLAKSPQTPSRERAHEPTREPEPPER